MVYSKPPLRPYCHSRICRALEIRAREALDRLLLPYYPYLVPLAGPAPLPAPYSITINLYKYLRRKQTIWLYDLRERGQVRLTANDILLGHPHPDPSTLVQQTFRGGSPCRCRALIFPLHHGITTINEYALELLDHADVILGIMGPYWYDTLGTSFLGRWKTKIVRLDMAVDCTQYPLVKRRFNPPGKRGYLYIGSNRPEKGCSILSQTMAQLTDFPKGWIGGGRDIPHLPRLYTYVDLTPGLVSKLASRYDFFVNTSISDANPTTILEAMAWGFPVACTPQSGYYDISSIISLSTSDIQANVETLIWLQHAPEEELIALSLTNRKLVETHYTWEHFCNTVWKSLEPYIWK